MTITTTRPKSAKQTPIGTAFTVDRKAFADAVGKVARYLPERAPVPVLRGILVEVDALGVTLTVTDYEELARTFVAADVETPGRFLVHGEHLARIARNLPDGPVHVECNGAAVDLATGRTRFTLMTMPTEDYPDMFKVVEQWRGIDEADGNPDAPTCRVVDMDRVKPRGADGVERSLYAKCGLATVKMWRAPGRASRPYEPAGLQVGAEITWTRHHGGGYGAIHETETITGQVWSVASGPHAVWALPEDEPRPVLVTQYKTSLSEHAESTESLVRRRALSEGTIVVEAEEMQPGDVVVGAELRSKYVPIETMGTAPYAGSVVESVGEKRKRGNFHGQDTFETLVKLAGERAMAVPDYHVVHVIRPATSTTDLAA